MVNALSPREIQARIRSGASVDDVVAESGMEAERVEAFAGPVLAEREHMASAAQTATIRRRGEGGTHRRLGDLIEQRLRSRGLEPEEISWDAWRQGDLKWRVTATLTTDVPDEARTGEFVFDPKARYSVADNADARWLIGEETPGAAPEEENTVDFSDELALVRAVAEEEPSSPGDDVPTSDLMHEQNEDTSQLDRLYDMLSGVSEDSVRIYTGIMSPDDEPPYEAAEQDTLSEVDDAEPEQVADDVAASPEPQSDPEATSEQDSEVDSAEEPVVEEPTQEPLVEASEPEKKPRGRKRRAKVPSWDEIMFGGPSK